MGLLVLKFGGTSVATIPAIENVADKVAAERHPANQDTPIFLVHGRLDPVIPIARATASRDLLQTLGYQVEWHDYYMQHSVCQEEVDDISAWLHKILK